MNKSLTPLSLLPTEGISSPKPAYHRDTRKTLNIISDDEEHLPWDQVLARRRLGGRDPVTPRPVGMVLEGEALEPFNAMMRESPLTRHYVDGPPPPPQRPLPSTPPPPPIPPRAPARLHLRKFRPVSTPAHWTSAAAAADPESRKLWPGIPRAGPPLGMLMDADGNVKPLASQDEEVRRGYGGAPTGALDTDSSPAAVGTATTQGYGYGYDATPALGHGKTGATAAAVDDRGKIPTASAAAAPKGRITTVTNIGYSHVPTGYSPKRLRPSSTCCSSLVLSETTIEDYHHYREYIDGDAGAGATDTATTAVDSGTDDAAGICGRATDAASAYPAAEYAYHSDKEPLEDRDEKPGEKEEEEEENLDGKEDKTAAADSATTTATDSRPRSGVGSPRARPFAIGAGASISQDRARPPSAAAHALVRARSGAMSGIEVTARLEELRSRRSPPGPEQTFQERKEALKQRKYAEAEAGGLF